MIPRIPEPRAMVAADLGPLTDLFATLWARAHDDCTPAALRDQRTWSDFRRRLVAFGDGLRVIGPPGLPTGFYALRGNHVDQLYVAERLWGTGTARALLDHAVRDIAAAGHDHAILECNPGNHRAAALALVEKLKWTNLLYLSEGGSLPAGNGECFVLTPKTRQKA